MRPALGACPWHLPDGIPLCLVGALGGPSWPGWGSVGGGGVLGCPEHGPLEDAKPCVELICWCRASQGGLGLPAHRGRSDGKASPASPQTHTPAQARAHSGCPRAETRSSLPNGPGLPARGPLTIKANIRGRAAGVVAETGEPAGCGWLPSQPSVRPSCQPLWAGGLGWWAGGAGSPRPYRRRTCGGGGSRAHAPGPVGSA